MEMLLHGNALLALAAAVLWGGGDFSGGMGVKHAGGSMGAALRVVLLSHATSFSVLLAVALMRGDAFPHGAPLLVGAGCGGRRRNFADGVLYCALARGDGGFGGCEWVAGSGDSGAVSAAVEGSPGLLRLAGFVVAGVAIWLIAAGDNAEATTSRCAERSGWRCGGGVGFGVYFVALKLAGTAGVIWPMATARMGSLSTCSLMLLVLSLAKKTGGVKVVVTRTVVFWALSTAVLDTSGNLLFIAATRAGRLDVAAVLASLYPASTILLAAWMLSERPTRRQGVGMAVAAAAVVMITI